MSMHEFNIKQALLQSMVSLLHFGGPRSPVELPQPCYVTFTICPFCVLDNGPRWQKGLHLVRDEVKSGEMWKGTGRESGLKRGQRLASSSVPVLHQFS